MAKKIAGYIKLQVPAGKANPSPPIGPALGQRGLNIMEFCKAFNAATQNQDVGTLLPVVITYYADKTFTFEIKEPAVPVLIKKAIKLDSASKNPGKEVAGKITMAQVTEIAKRKIKDMNAFDLEAAVSMVKGTAVSMGIEVTE
jgi:large subunit ribosomal protein L11